MANATSSVRTALVVAKSLVFDEHLPEIVKNPAAFRKSRKLGATLQSVVNGTLSPAQAGKMIEELSAWDSPVLVGGNVKYLLTFVKPTARVLLNDVADTLVMAAAKDLADAIIAMASGATSQLSPQSRRYRPLLSPLAARLQKQIVARRGK